MLNLTEHTEPEAHEEESGVVQRPTDLPRPVVVDHRGWPFLVGILLGFHSLGLR